MSAFLTMKQQPQKLTTEIILKMADFLALELWLDMPGRPSKIGLHLLFGPNSPLDLGIFPP